jgi:hypothetical protein
VKVVLVHEILLWVAALLLGPGLVATGLWQLYVEIRPRWWTPTSAQIIESRSEKQPIGRGGVEFLPIIELEYSYRGSLKRQKADIYTTGTQRSTDTKLAKYPLGGCVTVLVNPRTGNACLEPHLTPAGFVLIGLGLMVSVALTQFLGS